MADGEELFARLDKLAVQLAADRGHSAGGFGRDHLAVALALNLIQRRARLMLPFAGNALHRAVLLSEKAHGAGVHGADINIMIGIRTVAADDLVKMNFLLGGHGGGVCGKKLA